MSRSDRAWRVTLQLAGHLSEARPFSERPGATPAVVLASGEVELVVEAASLLDAAAAALTLIRTDELDEPVGVEVRLVTGGGLPGPGRSGLVSVSEAAQLLHISRQAVLGRIRRGSLPATKVGSTYAIPRSAVAGGSDGVPDRRG